MLINLSPWKKAKTSVRCTKKPNNQKKRDGGDDTTVNDFPAMASFVAAISNKGQQKLREHSLEFAESNPILTVTSSHQIAVLGQSSDHSIAEFSSLQFAGRPGNAGSFLTEPCEDKKDKDLPQIPAIFDAKNGMVYAFQSVNTRLCCWSAFHSTGPNDKKSLKVELSSPAVCMSLLPMHKGIVYGTCKDESIFVARVVTVPGDDPVICVEYIPNSRNSTQSNLLRHIGTFAELPQAQNKAAGRKRKVSDADGFSPVVFYQLYSDSMAVHLIRHEVMCERLSSTGALVIPGSHSQQLASIQLIASQEGKNKSLKKVDLLVSSTGTSPKAALVYTVSDTSSTNNNNSGVSKEDCWTRCALLSLLSGKFSHRPVSLPSCSTQFGLVTDTVVAAASIESISLYDLETGARLIVSDVIKEVKTSGGSWFLCTNAKYATLAILYSDGDCISSQFATLTEDESNHTAQAPAAMNLASKLASSVSSSATLVSDIIHPNAFNLIDDGESASNRIEDVVQTAVLSLQTTLSTQKTPPGSGPQENELLEQYERHVVSILDKLKHIHSGGMDQHNPQDALPSNENGLKNGTKGSNTITTQTENGIKPSPQRTRAVDTLLLPQRFVDGSMKAIVSFLCVKNIEVRDPNMCHDSVLILGRLIQTGKVSARMHFEENIIHGIEDEVPLSAILRNIEVCNGNGKRGSNSVDLILNILQRCRDVSERQLVIMMNYMLRHALPIDIAGTLSWTKDPFLKDLGINYITKHRKRQKVQDSDISDGHYDGLANKVIMNGSAYILQRILSYSRCNEAMLKVALLEELGSGQESIILAKLLSNSLGSRIHTHRLDSSVTGCICQWVSALCDGFYDKLSMAKTASGENLIEHLLQSVHIATKQTHAIVSLLDDLNTAEFKTELERNNKKEHSGVSSKELPGYSVNHLVF